jgi:5-hydroxyisourate hydrolase
MSVSSHILDTAKGEPARGVPIALERLDAGTWLPLAHGTTDDDGRLREERTLDPGRYRFVFDTAAYLGPDAFFPEAVVVFQVTDPGRHLHVPLLLSPFGLSTYRGS